MTDQSSVESQGETIGFDSLGLPESILKGITELGYTTPTEIQQKATPLILEGKDIVGASQTGTGKTAAFSLPLLAKLKKGEKFKCLILEPTRELAQQVKDALDNFNKYTGLRSVLLHGGVKYGRQREELAAGPEIVIATPGRLIDHVEQGTLTLRDVEHLVLDEADRMLDMGFLPSVRRIIGMTPKTRQSMMFSATTPPALQKLAESFLKDPQNVSVGGGTSTAGTINHAIYPVDDRQKFDLLCAILKELDYHSIIIFSRTKMGCDIIARWLKEHGHKNVAALHSDLTQGKRTQALQGFRDGKFEILVATDIVARGIDISSVSHVINYDVPENPQDYVHRIGRTGRMQQTGDAFTIYTAMDQEFLKAIERFIGHPIERRKVEGFDYNWTPVLEEKKEKPKKRNRGFNSIQGSGRRPRF